MHIFNENYVTVLDQTTSFLSLNISLEVFFPTIFSSPCIFLLRYWTKLLCYFSCVCFSLCIFMWGYWTKLPCAILLPLSSNWLEGIVKVALSAFCPQNETLTNSATIHTTISMVTDQMAFFFRIELLFHVISLWLYALVGFISRNEWSTYSFAMSFIIVDRPIFMTLAALWYLCLSSAPTLVF